MLHEMIEMHTIGASLASERTVVLMMVGEVQPQQKWTEEWCRLEAQLQMKTSHAVKAIWSITLCTSLHK